MLTIQPIRRVRAILDPHLDVVLSDLIPLVYAGGGSPEDDVPPHVRAASAVRRHRARLVIVQDDVNVLALYDGPTHAEAVLLPTGTDGRRTFDKGRGNKHAKMDLEACAVLPDGQLIAFGSGSTSARERLVVIDEQASIAIVDGRSLYALLRSEPAFAGSELNIEGALVVDGALRLFQRGNGAQVEGRSALNATCDLLLPHFLDWLSGDTALLSLCNLVQYDLGGIGEVPYTFNDAALMPDGRVAFVACAEASPDTVRDGDVLGCRFGIIDGDQARIADIRHPDRRPTLLKLEGIEPRPDGSFDVVADMDRPDQPALLGRLEVRDGGFDPAQLSSGS